MIVLALIVAVAVGLGVALAGGSGGNTGTGDVKAPSMLKYVFEKGALESSRVKPLFKREISPVKAMEPVWRSEYGGTPRLVAGFYSNHDYAIVLAGDAELIVEKEGANATHYKYRLKLVLHNATLIHLAPRGEPSGSGGVLEKLESQGVRLGKSLMWGRPVEVRVADRLVVETWVWVSKATWEYTDGAVDYGTWPYFIPRRPMAIVYPLLYTATSDPSTLAGVVFLLENKTASTAIPLQPSPWGEYTGKLLKLAREHGWEWVRREKGQVVLEVGGRRLLPLSATVPYKLVYDSSNVLESINLTLDVYDCACRKEKRVFSQEDVAMLIPPPLTEKVGRAIILLPYNDTTHLLELRLDQTSP